MKFGTAFLSIAVGSAAVTSFGFAPLVSKTHSKSNQVSFNYGKNPFFLSLVSEVRFKRFAICLYE
jgi:hypothetical protein